MKTAISFLLQAALGFGLLAGTSGCEQCEVADNDGNTNETTSGFCSVKRFTGDTRAESAALSPGGSVTIGSRNGDVRVTQGTSSNVDATFRPFVYRAFNTGDSEILQNFKQLHTTVTADAEGNVTVSVTRDRGSPSTLGANIVVSLPADFAGALNIDQDNGGVDVEFSGNATQLIVLSDNGSISASANAPSPLRLTSENGSVEASVSSVNSLELTSGNGSIAAAIGAVADGAAGGTIGTELGDIDLQMPSTGNYALRAIAADSVDFGAFSSTCMETVAAVNSKTLSCGTATPEFLVSAEGVGGVITVTY